MLARILEQHPASSIAARGAMMRTISSASIVTMLAGGSVTFRRCTAPTSSRGQIGSWPENGGGAVRSMAIVTSVRPW
jgi:hypothetical protein